MIMFICFLQSFSIKRRLMACKLSFHILNIDIPLLSEELRSIFIIMLHEIDSLIYDKTLR